MSTHREIPLALPTALVVGTWLPTSETFVWEQLKRQQRFRALVLAYENGPQAERFVYDPKVVLRPWENWLYQVTGYSRRFARALDAYQPVLIHAHFGPNGVQAMGFARRLGIPLVVSFHGHDVGGLVGPRRWSLRYARYNLLAPRLFAQARLVLPASADLARTLEASLGVPAAKIRVHRLGVDLEAFAQVERPLGRSNVLMVGRLVEKKGFDLGLRAFARARQTTGREDMRLTLVGDGPLRGNLQSLARRLGLGRAVRFTGALAPESVREELGAHDILLCPSHVAKGGDRESGVLILKEAGATGMAAIGTRHGGIPEILQDGATGFLVGENDHEALAKRLKLLVEAEEIRRQMGRAARIKMEREYDSRKQARELEDIYAEVVSWDT